MIEVDSVLLVLPIFIGETSFFFIPTQTVEESPAQGHTGGYGPAPGTPC